MPILDFSFCVGSSEDVPCLEVVVFRTPKNVREGSFGLAGYGIGKTLLFDIEDLY